jgi:hypothetical protein
MPRSSGLQRRAGALVALACLAVPAVLGTGCGDDDAATSTTTTTAPPAPTSTDAEETDTVPTTGTPAPGVTLTATVRLDGTRVAFDYALANSGVEPVAVVDPAGVVDALDPAGDGAYRASFLRATGDPSGGSPLPSLEGLVVAPGAELPGTAGITGRFDELPDTVQLCIEVVPAPWTDAGGGVARFPYRPTGTPATLACTDQLAVPPA